MGRVSSVVPGVEISLYLVFTYAMAYPNFIQEKKSRTTAWCCNGLGVVQIGDDGGVFDAVT